MAEMPDEELDRRIAEWLGDEGFLPAGCGAGHEAEKGDVGFVCPRCFESAFGPDDLIRPDTYVRTIRAHQEWRVLPKRPKHFSGSLDLLMPVVLRWCASAPSEWHVRIGVSTCSDLVWVGIRSSGWIGVYKESEQGNLVARALAQVLVEAMEKNAKEDGAHVDA